MGKVKIKASLVQPEISNVPFAMCEFEVDENKPPKEVRLMAAHELLQNFDIKIKRVK